jgi:hypothetical protein
MAGFRFKDQGPVGNHVMHDEALGAKAGPEGQQKVRAARCSGEIFRLLPPATVE